MSEIFSSIIGTELTALNYFICTAVAVFCGITTALTACYKTKITRSFFISLVVLPAIVQTVIMMVNGNVGTGIAVAGAFSLVRFRSAPGKAKDIAAIFLAMTSGLAAATGYIAVAIIITLSVNLLIILAMQIRMPGEADKELRITVPETLSFSDAFAEVFDKYTKHCKLVRVKTTNMGSLYRLYYRIELKSSADIREFIDELRVRNGNLEVSVSEYLEDGEAL